MESFKFITKNFKGKQVTPQDIKKMGLPLNTIKMVDTLEELREDIDKLSDKERKSLKSLLNKKLEKLM